MITLYGANVADIEAFVACARPVVNA